MNDSHNHQHRMIMNITQEIFQYFNSSATNPMGYGIFPMVKSEIYMAQSFVRSLTGDDIFDTLPDLDPAFDETDGDLRLPVAVARYICVSAYDRAIPHLDLVLTNDGFGVVNNQNVAPASAERVERLHRRVRAQADDALDELLDALRVFCPSWRGSIQAHRYFGTFFWRGSFASALGCADAHRSALVQYRSAIAGAEAELRNKFSTEFVEELLASARCNVKATEYEIAHTMCRRFIAASVLGDMRRATMMMRDILAFLDNNIECFPTYRQSNAYAANHFIPYENKKNDTCHFFGY